MTDAEAIALYGGFTATQPDPFAAKRRRSAIDKLHAITKLRNELLAYEKWVIERSITGRMYTDEDHAEIAVCEAMQGVQHTDELDGIIADLKRNVGLGW